MTKRWIVSAGAMLAVYGMVATTALAIFHPEAQMRGMTFSVASPNLKVALGTSTAPEDGSFQSSIGFEGLETMYPGMTAVKKRFWLWNASPDQTLRVKLRVAPGDQDWEAVKSLVQIDLQDVISGSNTGLNTLGQLVDSPISIPASTIAVNQKRYLELTYVMPDKYPVDPDGAGPLAAGSSIGEEAMGKVTSSVSFILDGTIAAE
jgi:hypothetical protein